MTRQDKLTELELIVDREGLGNVIDLLGEICDDKAEHLLTNWQDKAAAKHWTHDGRELGKLRPRLDVPAYI